MDEKVLRADTGICPYIDHYKAKGNLLFWGLAIGTVAGILLCMIGIVLANNI